MVLVRIPVPAPPVGGLSSIRRTAVFAARVWRARARLLRDASVLVVHDLYLLPLGWALSLRTGLPLVYDAHEEFAALEHGRYPPLLLRAVGRLETVLARRASVVVVPGETRTPRWEAAGIRPLVLPNVGRRVERIEAREASWDIAFCGGLSEDRRLDLLVDLARERPDLRVAIAGEGRSEPAVAEAARQLPNLDFIGYTTEPDEFLARARALYYGLEPTHPYAAKACPNTLYQAVRVGRPVLYLGGGEIERFSGQFRVAVQVAPLASALASEIDRLAERNGVWEFEAAWDSLQADRAAGAFAETLLGVAE
jgi:glycosyltransferase involved in cell wall biosynthesis